MRDPLLGPATGADLHVMTYNLRYASARGRHSWPRRRPLVAELLRREQPTVLGTQEGLAGQLRDLDADLPDHYTRVGQGRGGGEEDEHVAIYVDTRRLALRTHGDLWLSDTPEVPGSTSWGNTLPRMATWARLADHHTGAELLVVNTHLDHESEIARVRGAELLLTVIDPAVPVILTGDFNAPAGRSTAYRILTTRLTDTWQAATTPQYATFHDYGPPRPGDRIDWILTSDRFAVSAAGINTTSSAASDHFPVQALVTPKV